MSTVAGRDAPPPSELEETDTDRELVDALVPRPRSRRWAVTIVVLAASLVAGAALATVSGAVVPRLSATADSWSAPRGGPVHFTFRLHNSGFRTATVSALDLRAAGLDQGRTDTVLPIHIAGGHEVTITATFDRLDCAAISPDQYRGGITVTARGDLPLATTVTAHLTTHFTRPFVGMRTYSGADPLQIGWPAGITQDTCAITRR